MKTLELENLKEIINYQMELNGYPERFEDLQSIDSWYTKFTTTKEKEEEFRQYLRKYLKKFTHKERLEKEIGWFMLNYGLTINT